MQKDVRFALLYAYFAMRIKVLSLCTSNIQPIPNVRYRIPIYHASWKYFVTIITNQLIIQNNQNNDNDYMALLEMIMIMKIEMKIGLVWLIFVVHDLCKNSILLFLW